MITYKCRNCGAQLKLSDAGGFTCPYCGSRAFMSDSELKGNNEFRKKMVTYYSARAMEKENDYSGDTLWEESGRVEYIMENDQYLTVSYMDKYEYPRMTCYLAMRNVVYIFDNCEEADLFLWGLDSLVFPEADMKLDRCFPVLKQRAKLKDGKEALIFARKPYFYPAEVFAPYEADHLAWVISRMENMCCALEYSGVSHGDISTSSVFVNPVTHEGMLFGDWRKVGVKRSNMDLKLIRDTARKIMGGNGQPVQLTEFLRSMPRRDAYEDFEYWDTVIERGFGGHKFKKM